MGHGPRQETTVFHTHATVPVSPTTVSPKEAFSIKGASQSPEQGLLESHLQIIGGVLGSIAVAGILVFAVWFVWYRKTVSPTDVVPGEEHKKKRDSKSSADLTHGHAVCRTLERQIHEGFEFHHETEDDQSSCDSETNRTTRRTSGTSRGGLFDPEKGRRDYDKTIGYFEKMHRNKLSAFELLENYANPPASREEILHVESFQQMPGNSAMSLRQSTSLYRSNKEGSSILARLSSHNRAHASKRSVAIHEHGDLGEERVPTPEAINESRQLQQDDFADGFFECAPVVEISKPIKSDYEDFHRGSIDYTQVGLDRFDSQCDLKL